MNFTLARLDRRTIAFGVAIGWIAAACFLLFDLIAPFDNSINYARMVLDRQGNVLTTFQSPDQKWRFQTSAAEISPALRNALIYKEDQWFYWHVGVNPIAVVRALFDNLLQRRRTSGASTITMQCARLLRPAPRTWLNKCVEMVHAIQLELHLSKEEILELYCTLAPYGSNIEGVKAAAVMYFDKMPFQLSHAEVATLMVIPNRPNSLTLGRHNSTIVKQRNTWLARMLSDGIISRTDYDDAVAEPLVAKRSLAPRKAWHLSSRLAHQYPAEHIIESTLDPIIQSTAEALTFNHIQRLQQHGITNASVIVIDNRTRDVIGYVGSADPDNVIDQGQVDGVRAIRSPGSTLKPFLYASSFDAGLITPRTMLYDVPVNYDGYAPANYDNTYHGIVSMEEALATSLNVPAVTLLRDYGVDRFVDVLTKAGLHTIHNTRSKLGLSLVLGGCGVQLQELATAFLAFSQQGNTYPLRFKRSDPVSKMQSNVFSPSAAYVIGEALHNIDRPDFPAAYAASSTLPDISWKTGTSYGRRDAWSIGFTRSYTIGVWVGNFNGRGATKLSGAEAATPLMFDLARAISHSGASSVQVRPRELETRMVCSATGRIPSDQCTDIVLDDIIPGVSSAVPCSHLREQFTSADGKISYCTECLPSTGYKRTTVLNLPVAVLAYMRDEHHNIALPPPHNPTCTRLEQNGGIYITSPLNAKEYIIERATDNRLLLKCNTQPDATMLYWYIDDMFLTSAPVSGTTFIEPTSGKHIITVVDDRGRRSSCEVKVVLW